MKKLILLAIPFAMLASCGKSIPDTPCECAEWSLEMIKEKGGMDARPTKEEEAALKEEYKVELESCDRIMTAMSDTEIDEFSKNCDAQKEIIKMMEDKMGMTMEEMKALDDELKQSQNN